MSKLHELLAVEGDLEGIATRVSEEAMVTFTKRVDHFTKSQRDYKPTVEGEPEQPSEYHELTTTVLEKVDYVVDALVKQWDANIQKETTNQLAKADIIIDGKVIASNVPATALLGLETKIKKLRVLFESIPTLSPGVEWKIDENLSSGRRIVYRAVHAEEKNRTVKTIEHKVLVNATDKHPAQIEKWEELRVVGRYIKQNWSGLITVADKSNYLNKIDTLLRAVKQARQRANEQETVVVNIARNIFDYILQ